MGGTAFLLFVDKLVNTYRVFAVFGVNSLKLFFGKDENLRQLFYNLNAYLECWEDFLHVKNVGKF